MTFSRFSFLVISIVVVVLIALGALVSVIQAAPNLERALQARADCSSVQIPALPKSLKSQVVEAAEVQGSELYVLTAIKPFGGSEPLYGDPERKVMVRPDGGVCQTYIKLETKTSVRGEVMAHILGVYNFQGKSLGIWSQSGWVPEASLTPWTDKWISK